MKKLLEALETLTDTRRQWGNLRHKLVDIVFIGLVSVMCGGTDFEHMEDTGLSKQAWFKKVLELPNGIPDSDTFRRVFERIDPQELAGALREVVDVAGSTVTIDAMGCQKAIAAKIRQKGADYVLALKSNQPALSDDVKLYFENERTDSHRTLEKDHGRIESREYFLETDISWMPQLTEWDGLWGIGMVKSNVISTKTGERREECRYFITSLTEIETFASAVRNHWSIENQLHWQLDVTFREDSCRARRDNSPLNLNIMRKEALRLLKQADMGKRVSVRRKMARVAMDNGALGSVFE